ncbi:hypothetical protein ASC66_01175 [Leifsonia sp. Root4]|uniref:hypothetical protein n=1 Tax=Leifsonia sp. Root4 TaxID=1736525 RepID=UPI0006FBF779|nr:hypothetical protein [Leifsonia sp. Root4]KQW07640.1 hypothetical protein ASC66_01175 [Leifsonia sp. Root4]
MNDKREYAHEGHDLIDCPGDPTFCATCGFDVMGPGQCGTNAAKAEPLTIDREALALFLFSRDFGKRNWADVQLGEQQVYTAEADAVIAHLALSAQEAATEVEWANEFPVGGKVWISHASEQMARERASEPGRTLINRKVTPWKEVPNE